MNLRNIALLIPILFVACNTPIQPSKPKLVVGIVVDQMRMDYLTRFENHFGNEGFKRFYSEGFVAKNHHFDYAQTKTGPGHASISTGTPPAIHGVIGNEWFDKTTGEEVKLSQAEKEWSTLSNAMFTLWTFVTVSFFFLQREW